MERRRRSTARATLVLALAVAAATAIAVHHLTDRGEARPGDAAATRIAAAPAAAISRPAARAPRPEPCPAGAVDGSLSRPEDEAFLPWVAWKYRYLLADADLDACRRDELQRLLAARERRFRNDESADAPGPLREVDQRVRALVPALADRYDALRESDTEQRQLDAYAGGIENVAPLSDEQRRAVLSAKLRHKQAFERALREAGVGRPATTPEEMAAALEVLQESLDRYRDDFLLEASELLDEEQLNLLANYETTEFEQELERRRIAIHAR